MGIEVKKIGCMLEIEDYLGTIGIELNKLAAIMEAFAEASGMDWPKIPDFQEEDTEQLKNLFLIMWDYVFSTRDAVNALQEATKVYRSEHHGAGVNAH